MNRNASLVFIEQLLMVLVFALAAAVCLHIFVKADALATQTARQDAAAIIAQNAAELLQAGHDPACLDTGDYSLQIKRQDGAVPGLALAEITVTLEQDVLFSLETGWQEAME